MPCIGLVIDEITTVRGKTSVISGDKYARTCVTWETRQTWFGINHYFTQVIKVLNLSIHRCSMHNCYNNDNLNQSSLKKTSILDLGYVYGSKIGFMNMKYNMVMDQKIIYNSRLSLSVTVMLY